jgi:hypothetical protein
MKLKWRISGLNNERQIYGRIVQENLVGSLKRILHAMVDLDISFEEAQFNVQFNRSELHLIHRK